MHQSSRRHRLLAPDAQELILNWLLERENSPATYTNHHASGPAEGDFLSISPRSNPLGAIFTDGFLFIIDQATRTKSQQCRSSELPNTQSAPTPPRKALREGSSFAQRSPPLNRIRWSPYPEKYPIEKRTITEKGSKGGYERKPRNKTKEDRYEYKGSTSRIQRKQSPTKAKKSSKQVRRHTINDNFHASNVPRDRLTVCIVLQ
jgi:hypothetical protein